MPFRRILKEGGLLARLFIFASGISAWLGILSSGAAQPLYAAEDPFQSALDLDYGRSLYMTSDPPIAGIDRVPGFSFVRPERDPPRAALERDFRFPAYSATLAWDESDLFRRRGDFTIDHAAKVSTLDLATTAIPHLEFRFAADRADRKLDFGDSSAFVDLSGGIWGWDGAVTYLFTPLFVPALIVGGNDQYDQGNGLTALSIKGASAAGWEWAVNLGRGNPAFPLTVDLGDYAPISIPIRLRREFLDLGLRYHRGPWEGYWFGRGTRLRYPFVRPEGYSLGDSGSFWRQEAGAAFERNRGKDASGRSASGYRASVDFHLGYGEHAFRGVNRKGGISYPFSYEEAKQKAYSIRADLRGYAGERAWGAYAGGAETESDALRPDVPFNHYFWDRNGVIDSYQGSLLGVFNNETWLLNGAAYAGIAGGGVWGGSSFLGFPWRLGLDYAHLVLGAGSHLTKRETTLLFAFREERTGFTSPRIAADILAPEARIGKTWGPWTVSVLAAQAIPVRVDMEEREGEGGTSGSGEGTSKETSGGTRLHARLDLRIP
jgi:hypothetical protein